MSLMSVYYKVEINDVELDTQRYVLLESITHENCDTGSDLVTLVFNDPDMFLIEDKFILEESSVHVKGGFSPEDSFDFKGYISVIDPNFPSDGVPTITVHCMDESYIMNKGDKKKKTWENITHSEIAKTIFESYGLRAVVDDTEEVIESESQNETDINFLVSLANKEVEDYLCYVENGVGYYVKKKILDEPSYQLDYRWGNGQIQSFSPRINKNTKTVASDENIDLDTKNTDKATASVSEKQTSGVNTNTDTVSNNSSNKSRGSWTYNNGTWTKN